MEEKKPVAPKKEKVKRVGPENPGVLINSHNFDITISYGGVAMVIPPRARRTVGNKSLLGALPKGVRLV